MKKFILQFLLINLVSLIEAQPTITDPGNQIVCVNANAVFTVFATGGAPFIYQWQEDNGSGFLNVTDGIGYSGTTTSILTVNNVQLIMNGFNYRCIVTDTALLFSTSLAASLTVNPLPQQPAAFTTGSATVCQGQTNVVYTVPNDPGVSYNWSYSGSGATINGTGNSITIDFSTSASSGNLSVTATNGCGTSAAQTIAVIVNPLPQQPAAFTTSSATVCQGQTNVVYTVPNDPGVSYNWSYSGSGASINGTGNSITVDFSTSASSGNLSVTATNGCGTSAAQTIAVIVNPLPQQPAAFTTSSATVCQGQTNVVYTVPNDPGVSYNWSYNGSGATINGTGNSINVNFSTSASSGNLSVTATNGCGTSAAQTIAVIVNPLPQQPAAFTTSSATVCQGQTNVVYTVPNDPGVSYNWSYSGSGATISGTGNSITVDFSTSAVSGNISVTATNGCGTSAARILAVTVNSLPLQPAAFTASSATVCQGQTNVVYTIPNDPGVSYNWSYSGSGATISGTGNSITVNYSTSATSGNLGVTATNGCGTSAARIIAVTVNSLPLQPAAFTISSATVCQGQINVVYTVLNDPNVSYNWNYSGTGATINGTGNSITVNYSTSATSGNISVTATNGCGTSAARIIAVTVNSLPLQPAAFTISSATVCQGQINVVYTVPNDPNVSYNWNYSGTGATINGAGNSITVNYSTSATSGNISVTATNGCGTSAARILAVTVNSLPLQPAAFTISSATVCQGQINVVYTIPNDPGVSNNWSYSGTGATINGTGNSITVNYSISATSGNISVTATNGCGTSAARILAVTVNSLPLQPAAFTISSATVCQGQINVVYTIPNDPGVSYNWSYSGTGATINGTGNSITVNYSISATSGNISVTATNGCGTSAARIIAVTVNSLPLQPAAFTISSATVCQGQINVVYTIPNDPGVSYNWSYSGTGATINGTGNSITVNYSTSAVSGNLGVTATNGCGTSAARIIAVTVNSLPLQPAAFTISSATVCQGQINVVYTIPNDPGVSYNWSYSGTGATINGTGNSITVNYSTSAVSGNLGVTATNGCGTSAARILAVTVNSLPLQPVAFTISSATVCQGQINVVYTVPNDPNVSYNWNYSGTGATINGTGNSITVNYSISATSGNISVTATNGCGTSAARILAVTVNSLPLQPAAFTISSATVCQGQTNIVYTVPNDPNVSYNWSYSGTGATINGTGNSITVNFSTSAVSGNISVTATNGCGTSAARILAVTANPLPVQPAAFTISSATVCQGQTNVVYTVPNDPNVSYNWNYSGTGATINGTGNSITVNFSTSAVSGNISVTATNGCGTSAARILAVTANPLPVQPAAFTASSATVCQGQTNVVYTVPNDPNVSYNWNYSGTGATINGTGNSITVNFSTSAVSGNISVTATNGCGTSAARILAVTVNPLPPQAGFFTNGTTPICEGRSNISYAIQNDISATYVWNYSGSNVTINGSGNSVLLNFNPGATSGTLSVAEVNSCGTGVARTFSILVNPLPTGVSYVNASPYSSTQTLVRFQHSPPGGIFTGPGITSADSAFHPNLVGTGKYAISYTFNNNNGCSSTYTDTITVISANGSITGFSPNGVVCSKKTVLLIKGSPGINPKSGISSDWFEVDGVVNGRGITKIADSTANFDPSIAGAGSHMVKYKYQKGSAILEIEKTITIDSIVRPDFIGLNAKYCDFDAQDTIHAIVPSGGTGNFFYNGPANGLITPINENSNISVIAPHNIIQAIPGFKAATYKISYFYISQLGCSSDTIDKSFSIYALPAITFNIRSTFNIVEPPVKLVAIPSGGNFSGKGVIPADTTFSPALAGLQIGIPLTYVYTDNHGCSNSATNLVDVIAANATIKGLNPGNIYCIYGSTDTLIGVSTNGVPGGSLSGAGIKKFGISDTALFTPSLAGNGQHSISYSYFNKSGTHFSVSVVVTVDSIGPVSIGGLSTEYCSNNSTKIALNILSNPSGKPGSVTFSGGGVSYDGASHYFFTPFYGTHPISTITMTYTRNFSGCKSAAIKRITINLPPIADFGVPNKCINSHNDSIVFINKTSSIHPIVSWSWNFGDIDAPASENVSSLFMPKHVYKSSGTKTILLIATDNKSCQATRDSSIFIGKFTKANFVWNNDCYYTDSATIFSAEAVGTNSKYIWDFGDNSNKTDSINIVSHHYSILKNYDVKLITLNNFGCADTLKQTIYLRPVYLLSDVQPYLENFENGMNGWIPETSDKSGAISWKYGNSNYFISENNAGNNIWHTTPRYVTEQSWITSPCFNFSKVQKAMIKFDSWSSFNENHDGVVLQYKTNFDNTWRNVGHLNNGINWYESGSISGSPANQNIGWSGMDSSFVSSRNQLNSLSGKKEIRFRFVYGSDGLNNSDNGFAFDNIWIGERPRLVLLEHFTNSSITKCIDVETTLDTLVANEPPDVIDVRYHTDLLGSDMMDGTIHSIANVRTFYYGIPSIPYSKIDGGDAGTSGLDYSNYTLNSNDIELRSLTDPDFNIDLQATINGSLINVNAKISATKTLNAREITLHIAVVKKEIAVGIGNNSTIFRNVLVALLPTAAGTTFNQSWTPRDNKNIFLSYSLANTDTGKTIVVAFIQDESTKEILQTASSDRKSIFTGIGENVMPDINKSEFSIFPNPAKNDVNLIVRNFPGKYATIQIFNSLGTISDIIKLEKNTYYYKFNLSRYPDGIYFVKLVTSGSYPLLVKKLVVHH